MATTTEYKQTESGRSLAISTDGAYFTVALVSEDGVPVGGEIEVWPPRTKFGGTVKVPATLSWSSRREQTLEDVEVFGELLAEALRVARGQDELARIDEIEFDEASEEGWKS